MVQEDRRFDDGSVLEPAGPEGDHRRRSRLLEGGVRDGGLPPPRVAEKGPPDDTRHRLHGRIWIAGARREVPRDHERPRLEAGEVSRPTPLGGDRVVRRWARRLWRGT